MSESISYLHLPVPERILLAQEILDSVLDESGDDLFTPEQLEEIDRRIAASDADRVAAEPWETVYLRLRAQCKPAR